MKDIIVVAPEQYENFARRLVHEISKHPEIICAFWTIKQYEENEIQTKGSRFVIFIGNENENEFTEDYLPIISNLKNEGGVCFGFDASKAVAYGEGDLSQLEKFKGILKDYEESKFSWKKSFTYGGIWGVITIPFFPFNIIPAFLGGFAVQFFYDKKYEKILRTKQTEIALGLFMGKYFDKWVGLKK